MFMAIVISFMLPIEGFAVDGSQAISNYRETFTATIDKANYQYSIYGDTNNAKVLITNLKTDKKDILILKNDKFYLNGKVVGEIKEANEKSGISLEILKAKSPWKKLGKERTKTLSWKRSIGKAVLAGMIGTAIGMKAGPVIATGIGSALGYIASTGGATIKYTMYRMKAGRVTNYKCVWKLITKTKVKYGYYTSYMPG